jgi:hypothetical protein
LTRDKVCFGSSGRKKEVQDFKRKLPKHRGPQKDRDIDGGMPAVGCTAHRKGHKLYTKNGNKAMAPKTRKRTQLTVEQTAFRGELTDENRD